MKLISLFLFALFFVLGVYAQIPQHKLVKKANGKYAISVACKIEKKWDTEMIIVNEHGEPINPRPKGIKTEFYTAFRGTCQLRNIYTNDLSDIYIKDIPQNNIDNTLFLYSTSSADFDETFKKYKRRILDSLIEVHNQNRVAIFMVFDSLLKVRNDLKRDYEVIFEVPIDSVLSLVEGQTKPQKLRSYKYLFSVLGKYGVQEASDYAQKAIILAKELNDFEQEAELWLLFGNFKKELLTQKYRYDPPITPESRNKVLDIVGNTNKYLPEDVKRWNDFWGYATFEDLYYKDFYFNLYPRTDLLSDAEYLNYLKIRIAQKDTNKIVWAYKILGDFYKIKYGYDEAQKYYADMLAIREKQQDIDKICWTLGYIANFYLQQDKYQEAIQIFERILKYRQDKKDIAKIVWALGGMRYTKLCEGLPEKALEYQEQIFKLYTQLSEVPNIYNNTPKEYRYTVLDVVVHTYLNSFPNKEKEILAYLLKWRKESLDIREIKILVSNIRDLSIRLGDANLPIDFIKEILKTDLKIEDRLYYLSDVAFLYQQQQCYKQSLEYYKKALKLAKKEGDNIFIAIQTNKLGYFYETRLMNKETDNYYDKCLKILPKIDKIDRESWDIPHKYWQLHHETVRICKYYARVRKQKDSAKRWAKEGNRLMEDGYFKGVLKE
jgi:tetratricopeptide (TPR) repeat protein